MACTPRGRHSNSPRPPPSTTASSAPANMSTHRRVSIVPRNCTSGCTYTDDEASDAGEVDLAEALAESDDYYFYNLGDLFYYSSDPDGIQKMAAEYGSGETTGIDLPGEAAGQVGSAALRATQHKENPTGIPLPELPTRRQHRDGLRSRRDVGHPDSAGRRICHLRQRRNPVPARGGGCDRQPDRQAGEADPTQGHRDGQPAPLDLPTHAGGLRGRRRRQVGHCVPTVSRGRTLPHEQLSDRREDGDGRRGCGKEPNAWFVGFGPTNHAGSNPEYVITVVVDHGGYGAQAAAPAVANSSTTSSPIPSSRSGFLTATSQPTTTPPATVPGGHTDINDEHHNVQHQRPPDPGHIASNWAPRLR